MVMNRVASGSNELTPVASDIYVQLWENPTGTGQWKARDAGGREYWFTKLPALGDDTLWVLTEIRDRTGNNRVVLTYEVDTHANLSCGTWGANGDAAWTPAPELRLTQVAYGHAPGTECPKYQVVLEYGADVVSWPGGNEQSTQGLCATQIGGSGLPTLALRLLGFLDDDGHARVRTQLLKKVRVLANETTACTASGAKTIRTYELAYVPDADTGMPRLQAVDMLGTAGSAGPRIPVRRFSYGSVTGGATLKLIPAA
jgi:hypothetical protein